MPHFLQLTRYCGANLNRLLARSQNRVVFVMTCREAWLIGSPIQHRLHDVATISGKTFQPHKRSVLYTQSFNIRDVTIIFLSAAYSAAPPKHLQKVHKYGRVYQNWSHHSSGSPSLHSFKVYAFQLCYTASTPASCRYRVLLPLRRTF